MEHETFWTLIKDSAHWEFELFLIFIFDILIGLLMWPAIKCFIKDHKLIHKHMPFKSKAQTKYMFAKHPAIAKEFASKTKSIKALPEHKKKKK